MEKNTLVTHDVTVFFFQDFVEIQREKQTWHTEVKVIIVCVAHKCSYLQLVISEHF